MLRDVDLREVITHGDGLAIRSGLAIRPLDKDCQLTSEHHRGYCSVGLPFQEDQGILRPYGHTYGELRRSEGDTRKNNDVHIKYTNVPEPTMKACLTRKCSSLILY